MMCFYLYCSRPGAASPPSSTFTTPYNTLNRPMSGMGYDDSTMSSSRHQQNYPQGNSYGYERDREQQPDSRMDRRQDNYGGINATYASQHLSPEQGIVNFSCFHIWYSMRCLQFINLFISLVLGKLYCH